MLAIPVLRRQKEENQEFMIILGYIIGSRPAWATGGPISPIYASSCKKYRKGREAEREEVRNEGRAKERRGQTNPKG